MKAILFESKRLGVHGQRLDVIDNRIDSMQMFHRVCIFDHVVSRMFIIPL